MNRETTNMTKITRPILKTDHTHYGSETEYADDSEFQSGYESSTQEPYPPRQPWLVDNNQWETEHQSSVNTNLRSSKVQGPIAATRSPGSSLRDPLGRFSVLTLSVRGNTFWELSKLLAPRTFKTNGKVDPYSFDKSPFRRGTIHSGLCPYSSKAVLY